MRRQLRRVMQMLVGQEGEGGRRQDGLRRMIHAQEQTLRSGWAQNGLPRS